MTLASNRLVFSVSSLLASAEANVDGNLKQHYPTAAAAFK
jgi:hypothetical protein